MSYKVEELFQMEKYVDGYAIFEYLKKDDPTITEIKIPAEYKGKPVTDIFGFAHSKYLKRVVVPRSVREIHNTAFWRCESLETAKLSKGLEVIGNCAFQESNMKSIVLPKSLKELGDRAFRGCNNLESVTFNSKPLIEPQVFVGCPKLPPETLVMGLVLSTDITMPLAHNFDLLRRKDAYESCFRPDVFELLAKNNCFRGSRLDDMFYQMIDNKKPELFPIAEQYGMLEDAALLDKLISYSIEQKNVEATAYLLDYKNRKFGFDGGDKFEL